MHRKGINTENVKPEDILCDYCGNAAWAAGHPCIEGHQGSIVCGDCLTKAYTFIVLDGNSQDSDEKCKMCLEHRDDPLWLGHFEPDTPICKRCIKQAAGALTKSKDWEWTKPV